MPQKKKKTSSNRNKKSKSNLKKGKVQIPAYKIIILCSVIIAVCMGLLLVTTVGETEKTEALKSVAQRFEPAKQPDQKDEPVLEKKTEPKKTEAPKSEPAKKTATPTTTQKSTTTNKPDVKPPAKTVEKTAQKQNDTNTTRSVPVDSKKTDKESVPPVQNIAKPETKPVQPAKPSVPSSYNFPTATPGAQIVIIFDDGGQNLAHLEKFLDLPFPITVAVLPQLTYSVESAKRVRASGNELMLHQPMQAVNASVNPGPGAITPTMTEEQIRSTLFNNINQIGPIAGFNNHEGSAITADAEKMEVIIKVAEAQGVYFLDSRTNKDTQVPYVCQELGYSYYERNGFFLDNEKTKENALKELRKNLDIANKTGVVIMIGHVWAADFLPAFLKEVYPELKAKGYTFTTVSKCKGRKR